MADSLQFVPPRVPLTDPRTGLISREWYLFLQGIFIRIGGSQGQSSTDIVQDLADDAGVEEMKATVFANQDAINQLRAEALQATVDQLITEVQEQRDQITELQKSVQSLQQGQFVI